MVILIAGASRTGKTLLAQKLLEEYKYPYLSIDHLKMGLIRSGQCKLPAESDDAELTGYLWPIVNGIIKTCIENTQNIIVEGCYIPFGWEKSFTSEYTRHIKYICLIFTKEYIENNLQDILQFENAIERRLPDELSIGELEATNEYNLRLCRQHNYNYILIDSDYRINTDWL